MSRILLTGGTLYDPAQGIAGETVDLWIRNGKRVAAPSPAEQVGYRQIDCSGRVIMPGGVDMHSHLAGPKVNWARRMQPELGRGITGEVEGTKSDDWRIAGNRTVPTILETGRKYLGLGYTTAFDAAIAPAAARATRAELGQLPYLDAGYFLLLGNHHFILDAVSRGDSAAAQRFVAWVLWRCGGYAVKLVNPGGVENFKRLRQGNVRDLSAAIAGFDGATPGKIISALSHAVDELRLPHSVHLHCNNLGLPGNWQTTLETMRALGGRRGHFAHIQFHSYGGANEQETTFCSRVAPLADFVNAHPEITLDVGQIQFGTTTSMTGDSALGYYLSRLHGRKYVACDTEIESGCGISPIEYKEKNFVHAMQWAIGLEWFLAVRDPWQVALSTDHPNGASFLSYPRIIRLLMDREYRREALKQLHPRVLRHSPLYEMDREYGLNEIAIITRAGPARALGLTQKGHLGIGADADITVYDRQADYEKMFQFPWLVIKSGEVVLQDGELLDAAPSRGAILEWDGPQVEPEIDRDFDAWISRHYSFAARHFGIRPTRGKGSCGVT